ncbi:tellurite resistance TerB family protein [Streptomyces sp. NPDC052013]|uniref:tellurite resistance TerB family protein n=1 Tax=Streptomyces sp. NPDC052013 TaxID=3365679 RepID=UPI0037D1D850
MAMWDRLKDQARALQQSQGGRAGGAQGQAPFGQGHTGGQGHGGGPGHGARSSSSGSKAQLIGLLKSQLAAARTELKSGAFRDASMAVCALVAAADGHVDPAERQRVEELIVADEVLQNFPAEQLRKRFNEHVDRLVANFQAGKAKALEDIAKAAKKPVEARAVIQTGIVIAGADGHIEASEQHAIHEACAALGLSPAEFGI